MRPYFVNRTRNASHRCLLNRAVPAVKGKLELVQPDLKRGDALLGVCSMCPAWFLIDGRDGAMIDLGLADRLSTSSLLAMSD